MFDWVGALIQGVHDYGMGMFNYNAAKKASEWQQDITQQNMDYQAEIARRAYAERYQATAQDMRAAGLNPILASSGGFSVGDGPRISGVSNWSSNNGYGTSNNLGASAAGFAEASTVDEKIEKLKAETNALKKEADLAIEKAITEQKTQGKLDADTEQSWQKVLNLEKEFEQIHAKTWEIMSQAQLNVSNTELNEYKKTQVAAERDMLLNSATKIALELKELMRTAEVYEGPAGLLLKYIEKAVSSVGINPVMIFGKGAIGGAAPKSMNAPVKTSGGWKDLKNRYDNIIP